jgi:diguanylate cyclase (GGDEF)-like protein/PAS domain S-box-containing protein
MQQVTNIRRQTDLTTLFGKIAFAANEANSIDEILQISLRSICETTGWSFGIACLVDKANPYKPECLHWYSGNQAGSTGELLSARLINSVVENGFLGKLIKKRRPVKVTNIVREAGIQDSTGSGDTIIKSGYLFPISLKQEIVGFMGFFYNRKADPDLAIQEVMIHICTQVGRVFERVSAEESLRKSESLLRRYFDSGLIGMAMYSPDKGWLQVNDTFYNFLGYTEAELKSLSWDDISLLENFDPGIEGNFELVSWGKHGSIRDKHFVRKDGKVVYGNVSLEIIHKEDGSIDYIVILLRDITDKVAANEALKISEELLRSFFNAGYVGMSIITGDKKFSQVNDALCDIVGYAREELLDMSLFDLVHKDVIDETVTLFDKIICGDVDGYTTEKKCVHKNGYIIYVSIAVECVRKKNGTVDYMVAFLQDITRKRQAEMDLYRYNRALNVLNQCNHTIVHAASGQQMINEICRIIIENGGYRFAWVGYAKADVSKLVYPVASAGHEAGYLDYCFDWKDDNNPFDPVSDAIRTGDTQIVKNLTIDPVYGAQRNAALERGYRSEIALPLKAGSKSFGALMIYSSEPDAFDKEEEKLLVSLAEDLAYGILAMYARARNERDDSAVQDNDHKFKVLYDESPAMFFTLNDHGKILSVNKYGAEELGYRIDELSGMSFFDLSNNAYKQLMKDMLATCLGGDDGKYHWEQQKISKSGKIIWVKETMRVYTSTSGERKILVVSEDITEIRKRSEQLSFQATHDSLTGLINRGEFETRLENLLISSQSGGGQHALCFLDLDQFKIVNDTCGHLAGDEMLKQIGMILQDQIRKRDTIARLGGDEFVILMDHCPLHRAEIVAKKILKSISDYKFIWEDKTFRGGVSIGIVAINGLSGNINDVLKSADAACYAAKKQGGGNIHIYKGDDTDSEQMHGEMFWVSQIIKALENDQFQLYFQPIAAVRKTKNRMRYFEVLVRMKADDGSIISPDEFMPVAERHNLSTRIDKWVIGNLFSLFRDMPEENRNIYQFSINLSGHSLGNKDLESFIERELEGMSNQPETICFEITETAAIANLSSARRFIDILRGKGCLFALDDFGSGLSSYSYLKNLNIDYLKIDGQFIKDITVDSMSFAIVRSIHEIGRALGKKTVAEFVENKAILDKLRIIGIDYVQGSYIGKEMAYEELVSGDASNIIKFNKSR